MSNSIAVSMWSTSTLDQLDVSPDPECASLSGHAQSCARARGPLFLMRCAADGANAFLAQRFITTLMVFTLFLEVLTIFL